MADKLKYPKKLTDEEIALQLLNKQPDSKFSLIKAIRNEVIYKNNIKARDSAARKYLEKYFKMNMNKNLILPGQLIMFDYLTPKYKDELEYYDGKPCTIFFGIINTNLGKRVIGFNMHYYPPRIRYQLMDKIFEVYKSFYINSWSKPINSKISNFDYRLLIYQLQKAKLDFGIRMYCPELIRHMRILPANAWSKAVFTEGRFFKATRDAIINYWNNKKIDYNYIQSMAAPAKQTQKKINRANKRKK